jgi:hypothetical protein
VRLADWVPAPRCVELLEQRDERVHTADGVRTGVVQVAELSFAGSVTENAKAERPLAYPQGSPFVNRDVLSLAVARNTLWSPEGLAGFVRKVWRARHSDAGVRDEQGR